MIGFGSTFLSVFLGTLAVYGFSRFRVPLKDDLLFFILSAALYPHMNIRENTGFPLRCIGARGRRSGAASRKRPASCGSTTCWRAPWAGSPAATGSGWRSAAPSSSAG